MLERVPIAIVAAVVGWCLGWLSAWLTDWLLGKDNLAPVGRSLVVRDLSVQAGCALAWAAAPLLMRADGLRWAEVGVLAVPLIQFAVTDIRTRYVYSVVAAIGIVLGLIFGWQAHNTDMQWWTSVAGALGGFVAFGLLWLLGRVIYRGRVEAMARGDITIAAMVGAGAAGCTPFALFVGVLCGGLIAVGVLLSRHSRHTTMPYGPGLCLGGLAALFWC